jgi:hypothetical protein
LLPERDEIVHGDYFGVTEAVAEDGEAVADVFLQGLDPPAPQGVGLVLVDLN